MQPFEAAAFTPCANSSSTLPGCEGIQLDLTGLHSAALPAGLIDSPLYASL